MDFSELGIEFSKKEEDMITYSVDASNIPGKSLGIVWPKNTEEVSRVLKYCHDRKIPVTPRGAGTSLAAGATPTDSLVLDLSKMNRILDIGKESVVVEAGVIIRDLNLELEKHDLVFPVKPASARVCQVGGAISTNAAGERAIKYGKIENWVESVEVVFATGRIKWTKPDDFVGTEGLMGVITKAKLKVTQPPRNYSIEHKVFEDVGELLAYIKDLKDLLSVEFINASAAELMELEKGNHIIVEFESDQGLIKDEKDAEKIIHMREGAGPVLTTKGFVVMEDPFIPQKKMKQFLNWLGRNKIPAFGHIAFGIIHPRFEKDSKKIEKMFEFVEKVGGDVSGEHGIGLTKKKFLKRSTIDAIRKMKKKHDAYGILNRDKVISWKS
jgi:glycolate oxidase